MPLETSLEENIPSEEKYTVKLVMVLLMSFVIVILYSMVVIDSNEKQNDDQGIWFNSDGTPMSDEKILQFKTTVAQQKEADRTEREALRRDRSLNSEKYRQTARASADFDQELIDIARYHAARNNYRAMCSTLSAPGSVEGVLAKAQVSGYCKSLGASGY